MRIVLALLLAAAPALADQPRCIAFVVPPNVPIFFDAKATKPVPGVRYRAVLAVPEASLPTLPHGYDDKRYVARDRQAAEAFACTGETFITDRDSATVRVAVETFRGTFIRAWVRALDPIPFEYGWPGSWATQDQQATLTTLRDRMVEVAHASGLAATPQEAEENRLSRLAPCRPAGP